VLVKGWFAVPRRSKWEGPFVDVGELRPLELVQRADVEAHFGDEWQVTGYQTIVAVTPETSNGQWNVVLRVDGNEYRETLHVDPSSAALDEFRAIKQRKLERIERILRCPRPINGRIGGDDCHGELTRTDSMLECTRCGARYERTQDGYDFLPADLAARSGIVHTDNTSSWGLDPYATQIIRNHADGLVLDAGSGFKSTVHEHVVNLEVVGYPSTDVLGVGEHLPFADASFDAVLSMNVLEHVRDPFRCASEIARVVRPGGRLYATAPFLQPYHGYPHHYYNMTASGLENLFTDGFWVDQLQTPDSAVPIFSLSWFLNSYVAGLPAAVAARFKKMTVDELMKQAEEYLDDDFVTELRTSTNIELASGCMLIGTRRSG
jgi:SAM-dependent methyltransferase